MKKLIVVTLFTVVVGLPKIINASHTKKSTSSAAQSPTSASNTKTAAEARLSEKECLTITAVKTVASPNLKMEIRIKPHARFENIPVFAQSSNNDDYSYEFLQEKLVQTCDCPQGVRQLTAVMVTEDIFRKSSEAVKAVDKQLKDKMEFDNTSSTWLYDPATRKIQFISKSPNAQQSVIIVQNSSSTK